MLTDLGSNCFGDADIGPLCFIVHSFVDVAILGQDALKKKSDLEIGCVGPFTVCVAVAMLIL
jgi:hypothetical protein